MELLLCVDDKNQGSKPPFVVEGRVYTLRGLCVDDFGAEGVLLWEIFNDEPCVHGGEWGWHPDRFIPYKREQKSAKRREVVEA